MSKLLILTICCSLAFFKIFVPKLEYSFGVVPCFQDFLDQFDIQLSDFCSDYWIAAVGKSLI